MDDIIFNFSEIFPGECIIESAGLSKLQPTQKKQTQKIDTMLQR